METRRWLNPSQPQTLQIAIFLLYINAFFALLFGGIVHLYGIVTIFGGVGAGFGIVNEKKWGYGLGLAVAVFPFLLRVAFNGVNGIFSGDVINLMFEIALIALLLHPQSRDYQRIWFS